MRMVFDNAIDRATLSVTDAVPGMGADHLQTDIKGQVCRVAGEVMRIVATWPTPQTIGAVVIPASSLGPSSTIAVRAYADEAGADLLEAIAPRWAAPGLTLEYWDFTQPLNVNQFAWTPPPIVAVYLQQHQAARRLEIELSDPGAPVIDVARLVAGRYLQPEFGAQYGQQDGAVDMSNHTRAASGDLKTERGPVTRSMTFDLGAILPKDRHQLHQVLDGGIGRMVFISLAPGHADPVLERDKSIYGKLSKSLSMKWVTHQTHNASFEVEGF